MVDICATYPAGKKKELTDNAVLFLRFKVDQLSLLTLGLCLVLTSEDQLPPTELISVDY